MEHPLADFLRIEVREEGDVVVHLVGELDVLTAPDVRTTLFDLAASGEPSVVVDLTNLTFIDSTGLGVLVGAHERFRLDSGELTLRNATRPVARVLDLSGVKRVLHVEDSVSP